MPKKTAIPLLLLLAALAPSASRAGDTQASPAQGPAGPNPQRLTVDAIRNIGTAMFSWLVDQLDDPAAKTDKTACKATRAVELKEGVSWDVEEIPTISWEELTKILVPQYIHAIDKADAWGNPYEFRLNVADTLCPRMMAIRSAGADGRYSGPSYTLKGFPPGSLDEDLVWTDGYFVRYPGREKAEPRPEKR